MQSYLENLTNCRKYCNGPVVIKVRFVTRLEECRYFALFPNDWKYTRVNTGAILSAESLSLALILSKPIALFVFKVLR